VKLCDYPELSEVCPAQLGIRFNAIRDSEAQLYSSPFGEYDTSASWNFLLFMDSEGEKRPPPRITRYALA